MKASSRNSKQVILRHFMFVVILFMLQPLQLRSQDLPFIAWEDHPWVDSVLSTLSNGERIAQSIFLTTGPGRDLSHYILVDELIKQYGMGGLLVSQEPGASSGVWPQAGGMLAYFRSVSRVPLALALDGGGHAPESSAFWPGCPALEDFPGPWTLGAAADEELAGQMGDILCRQYREMGVQLVLTPSPEIPLPAQLLDRFTESRIQLLTGWAGPGGTGMEGIFAGGISVIDVDEGGQAATERIWTLLERGAADTAAVNQTARRVLAFKYWSGLHRAARHRSGMNMAQEHGLSPDGDAADSPGTLALVRDVYASSLTLLQNQGNLVPLKGLAKRKVACISLGVGGHNGWGLDLSRPGKEFLTPFQEMAANYTRVDQYSWYAGMPGEQGLLEKLAGYDVVLAGIYPTAYKGNADRNIPGLRDMLTAMSEAAQVITVLFGEPESIPSEVIASSGSFILAYRRNVFTEELAAQLIFGGTGASGRLPLALGDSYAAGSGLSTTGGLRLQYAYPENAGLSSVLLHHKIDSVVGAGLQAGAFPGCEVIAARNGKIVFHKTYGYQTYHQRSEVHKEDLYDLASVTKVSGPLAGLMMLEGTGRFSHGDRLGKYAPSMAGSDKAALPLKDILAHRAGLYPWIPYWQQTVKKNGDFKRRFVSSHPSGKYSMVMADRLYLKEGFRKKIYRTIRKSELGEKEYLYSGLAFFLFPGIIEDLSGERYEDFLYENIYRRLGAWDLVYNPLRFYPAARIVPTEYDSIFRRQQIHGYVHDESAATMGGFSGNAGLFATAGDLLKLVEMYRRMGSYGGEQLIPEAVLKEYTSYQFPEDLNRRGLGFDKPLLDERDGTPGDYPCPGASPSSFGHSGFTGTFVWADPQHGISYVFLSNRVYPTRSNNLISEMNIRTEVLQAIYDSMEDGPAAGNPSGR